MAPNAPMTRPRVRREPPPLDQLPAWGDLVPVMDAPAAEDPVGLDALLGGLNPDQFRAVTHGEGPLLIVAGAGTGKTQVITRRIAWLIATRRARPSEILALTFTDKAAEEMAVRVDQLVPYGYTDTAISTFHAFGDGLIREFALELGLPPDVRVLSRAEVVIFLREHLFEFELDQYRPLGNPTRFLAALAALFSRCKDEDIAPGAYLAFAEGLATEAAAAVEAGREDAEALTEAARRQLELARAYTRYQDLLATNGFIDFGDQVALALRLVRESAEARERIQARFRYILVDEFQDTNRAQAELVGLLAERHRNVTVVGDDDQAIYAFRGAAIDNILDFQARYRGARTVVLRRNYRSHAPVLDAAYRLIRFNDPDRLEVRTGISKRLRPERVTADPVPVRVEAFASGSEEADWVAAEIGSPDRERGTAPRPRGPGACELQRRPDPALAEHRGDPVAVLGDLRVVRAARGPPVDVVPAGRCGPVVERRCLRARGVGAVRARWRGPDRHRHHGPAPQPIRVGRAGGARSPTRHPAHCPRQPGERHPARCGPARLQRTRARAAGWRGALRLPARDGAAGAPGRDRQRRRRRGAPEHRPLLRDRPGPVGPALGRPRRCSWPAISRRSSRRATTLPPRSSIRTRDAVAVLTVHKAKGLEFPVVFLPGLVAGRFPLPGRGEPLALPGGLGRGEPQTAETFLAEERRLFYVAMTRARDELILSHAADYGGARARRVSPFVLEALDLPAAAGAAGAGAAEPAPMDRLAAFAGAAEPAEALRGPIEEPLSLSFYQVDDYLTCPLKYKYAHVLRVPLAPHHAIIYGAALHKAVQFFHHRHARGQVMSDAELIEVFEAAWTNDGFVSREHEEARLEAGRAALRRFREAQLAPDAVIPTYVEREFSFTLDGDRVRGRWDRVDVEPAGEDGTTVEPSGPVAAPHADVVTPTLGMLGRERVTITDYKSSDVRDPAKARQRARDSLQLAIYAMGYEAMTGRLPDAVQLHFLELGLIGRVDVDPKRLAKARKQIAQAASGIRARDYTARPDYLSCTYCAFRDICPASAAT